MHYAIPISQRLKKLIRSLHQRQHRDQNFLFIAEGEKLCQELLRSEFIPELIVTRDSSSQSIIELTDQFHEKGVPIYSAPKHQFDQMTNAKSPQSIFAVVNKKESDMDFDKPFIALDGLQDPGNVGTIIRTAEWFGIKQVIVGGGSADYYGPKAVRSSMGSIFFSKLKYVDDLAGYLKENFGGIKKYGACLGSENQLISFKPENKEFGLVFGSESKGISDEVNAVLDDEFEIKGLGQTVSLNVSIAVGITLYYFTNMNS
jgi:TrmH family RNA methyltransferase